MKPPNIGDKEHCEKMEEHIEKYVRKIESVYHEIMSDLIHLDVFYIKPTQDRNFHTFVTAGMSYLPMTPMKGAEEDTYAELMICLPETWEISEEALKDESYYWPIRWLKMLARFPHDHKTWLGFAHTMPNGDPPEPLTKNTKLTGVILLPPIGLNKDFWSLRISDDKIINYYCIMPLYKEEMDLKLKEGYRSLLDKFSKNNVSIVLDLSRKNTCKKGLRFW